MLKLIACPADETVRLTKTLAEQHDKLSKDMLEFIETVLVYKLPELSREEIRIMLALNDVQLKQTRFYREIAEEERREGKLEGKLEGETELLNRLLAKRFGPLPPWAQQKLAEAKLTDLESWSERILDAQKLENVFE
ncbi:MAG: DUF4351 domain-containing protein [Methylomonas sp.]|jgi:predicted transposase YdaD